MLDGRRWRGAAVTGRVEACSPRSTSLARAVSRTRHPPRLRRVATTATVAQSARVHRTEELRCEGALVRDLEPRSRDEALHGRLDLVCGSWLADRVLSAKRDGSASRDRSPSQSRSCQRGGDQLGRGARRAAYRRPLARAPLEPEMVWLAHEHGPWRPLAV